MSIIDILFNLFDLWLFSFCMLHWVCFLRQLLFENKKDSTQFGQSLGFWGDSSCSPIHLQSPFGLGLSILIVLLLWSCPLFIPLPTSLQSCTSLPRVIELPSPTSTEGPDATESDYMSSSSSFYFSSSSSSIYATSSPSTSDKVSQRKGLCLSGNIRLSSLLSFCSLDHTTQFVLAIATFPLVVIDDAVCLSLFALLQW